MIVYLESPVIKVAAWLMMFMRMVGKKVTMKMPKNCLDRTMVTLKLHSPDSGSYFLLNLVFWLIFFCDMAIFVLLHTVPTTLKVVINYPISLTKWMGTYTFDPLIIKINYIGLMEKIFLFRFLFRFFLRQS